MAGVRLKKRAAEAGHLDPALGGDVELALRRTRERVDDLAGERRRVPPPLVERQVDEGNRSHGAMLGRVVQVV